MTTANTFESEVAIIGISGRFPQAEGIDEFWSNLRDGVESILALTDEDLRREGVGAEVFNQPGYVKAKAVLKNIEMFDAAFFGYSPREAEMLDPQQRIFLECAWEAFESAGYDTTRYASPVGVFAGASNSGYVVNLLSNPDAAASLGSLQLTIGNDKDHLPTRVSYKLDLKGPSVNVQTACSTSLVAVHLACQSLLSGDCDMALAGGVSVAVPHNVGYFYQEGGITSPDGHCRAFDAEAAGTVSGNGIAVVLLKRLADALADGDTIHAVIKGSAINNDGARKVGYTAPGVEGQAAVIADALAVTGVDSASITYVETHGTGTALGDPIEVAALTQAFAAGSARKGRCALGSVKSNIGHLDAAAGATGLIKAALALKHKQLPPSLHFEQPNPQIDFANSPFYVNNKLTNWESDGAPRRAGVSSFGIGGTNAHVILEEAPEIEPSAPSRSWQMLTLSARTASALETATTNLAEHLRRNPDINLADAAYTLHVGRRGFEYRRLVVCRNAQEAAAALGTSDPKRVATARATATPRPAVFMFPGGGAQYADMGRELYEQEQVFREEFDRCAELLAPHTGFDLREALYADGESAEEKTRKLDDISLALPAIFAVEYALAQQLMAWGVRPEAMIGHSLGEYTAACLAGVFSLEDALSLVALRAHLFAGLPTGAMLSVNLPETELRALLDGRLSIAAVNSPSLCVVSGPVEAVTEFERVLVERGAEFKRLHLGVAAHSAEVEPVLDTFAEFFKHVRLHEPRIPYLSNVTGRWITAEEATSPAYWVSHLRHSVRFADGVQELLGEPGRVLLEVGPGHTLKMLAASQSAHARTQVFLNTMPHPQDRQPEGAVLLKTFGQLWLAGVAVDAARLYDGERRHRVQLPTYPFERQRYWIERRPLMAAGGTVRGVAAKNPNVGEWFYLPSWRRSMAPGAFRPPAAKRAVWLLFSEGTRLSAGIVERLEREEQRVIIVFAGTEFERRASNVYAINPSRRADYDELMKSLRDTGRVPDVALHLWSVNPAPHAPSGMELFEQSQERGYYSILFLVQSFVESGEQRDLRIVAVADRTHELAGAEDFIPEKATLLAPCKIVSQEFPHVTCRHVDVVWPQPDRHRSERVVEQLLAEAVLDSSDKIVAYRANLRLAQEYQQVRLEEDAVPVRELRERGVYLIVGGLGRVGRQLAEYLARTRRARLVLTGRTELPARAEWEQWLASHDEQDATSKKLRSLLRLEEIGAEVMVIKADASDAAQTKSVLAQIDERFGALDGVIYAATHRETVLNLVTIADEKSSREMFRPKVAGLYALEEALRGREVDFCLLLSSNASVLGGPGFITYAAANNFVDAFAAQRNKGSRFPWISTNWDGWLNSNSAPSAINSSLDKYAMTSAESVEAFRRVVTGATVGQVVVSTGDLRQRLDTWVRNEGAKADGTDAEPQHERPAVASDYIAPRNELEKAVASVWQQLLGIREIGMRDNFFELGGHSLLATQVIARIRESCGTQIPLRSIFENPTVEELSAHIEQLMEEEVAAMDEDELAQMLQAEA